MHGKRKIPARLLKTDMSKAAPPARSDPGKGGAYPDVRGLLAHTGVRSVISDEPHCATVTDDSHPAGAINYLAYPINLFKAIGPGERWITVKPPGHDKGQPLLIRDMPDGSSKVIGGAGGSMNHLRLTGVRSTADYKAEALSRAKNYREKRNRQAEQDRRDGLTASKSKAREAIHAEIGDHEVQFLKTVSDALGWKQEDMRFPAERYQNASPEAQAKAAATHARDLFRKAQEAVKFQRDKLVQDAEMRAQSGLGEVPLTAAEPEAISVQDLAPIPDASSGLGFAPDYDGRAERAGLTDEALADEAAASRPAKPPRAEGAAAPGDARKEAAERVAKELAEIRERAPKVDSLATVDAKTAVELLKAEKLLKAVRRDAREKRRMVDGAKEPVEPKAYVLETGQASDADIERDLENDLRTIRTQAFLDEVGKQQGGEAALGRQRRQLPSLAGGLAGRMRTRWHHRAARLPSGDGCR